MTRPTAPDPGSDGFQPHQPAAARVNGSSPPPITVYSTASQPPAGTAYTPAAGTPVTAPSATRPAPAAEVEEATVAAQLRRQVAQKLADYTRQQAQSTGAALSDAVRAGLIGQLINEALDAYTAAAMGAGRVPMPPQVESRIRRRLRDGLLAAGGLQPLLDDPDVEDITANGCDQVWVRRVNGRWEPAEPVADSDEQMVELIRTLAARGGLDERRWDRAAPILDLQLADGARLNAVMAVAARPSLSIRRHHYLSVTLAQLADNGTLDAGLVEVLGAAVRARCNIMVAGRTGAGKTTLLRALAAAIGPSERLVTIEDSYELALDRHRAAHPNVVSLQTRDANVEGVGAIDMGRLFRTGLRMMPDRVIVGEVRGDEVVHMLNAMSQGNDGSLSTVHARSSAGVFAKLALYALQSPQHIDPHATALLVAESINLVVHLSILDGHHRAVSSVREVVGADGGQVVSNEIYRPGPHGHAVPGAPMSTGLADLLQHHGLDLALLHNPAGWWPVRRFA